MDQHQEMLAYYCRRLHSAWAQKKALAYLRILAEAEGDMPKEENKSKQEDGRQEQPPRVTRPYGG